MLVGPGAVPGRMGTAPYARTLMEARPHNVTSGAADASWANAGNPASAFPRGPLFCPQEDRSLRVYSKSGGRMPPVIPGPSGT